MDEVFELVDEQGRVVGRATRRECHSNPSLIHQAVHVLVFDEQGRLFLQKRSARKDIQPGKWDTSVGGHLQPGETPETGARREMLEELGVAVPHLEFLYQYLWRSPRETELVRTYRAQSSGPFQLQAEEIETGRFWEAEEIAARLGTEIFTPNFEVEFDKYHHGKATR